MNIRYPLAILVVLAATCSAPAQLPALPTLGQAPLLYVRFTGPEGMKVSFFQGRAPARSFNNPTVVGLRPGYIYRVEMTGFPGKPQLSISPTLEVRNTLVLPPGILAANYPAPVTITDEDIDDILAGAMVTKVVYLENPDKAQPVATQKGEALETTLPPDQSLDAEARERGRPMVIVRLGQRVVSADELAAYSIPGTILFPGERSLSLPRVSPPLAFDAVRFFDPRYGRKPATEELLHDGGDRGPRLGFGRDGVLGGLDAEDSVAEWTDSAGKRRLTPSNRVCLCVPRYAVLRNELPIGRYDGIIRLEDKKMTQAQGQMDGLLPPRQTDKVDSVQAVRGRERPTTALSSQGPTQITKIEIIQGRILEIGPFEAIGTRGVEKLDETQRARMTRQIDLVRAFSQRSGVNGFDQVEGTAVVGRTEGSVEVIRATASVRDITVCCNEAPIPPDQPLRLFKWADRQAAQVGDVVTFSLKYSNVGGRPIADVAVSDSLSPRLEYVPGSSQADRDAVFTVGPNEAGSMVLRWEISGKLQPGAYGIVRFKAKVR